MAETEDCSPELMVEVIQGITAQVLKLPGVKLDSLMFFIMIHNDNDEAQVLMHHIDDATMYAIMEEALKHKDEPAQGRVAVRVN